MAFVRVGSASQLPSGGVIEVEIGADVYAICHAGNEFYALDGICPHSGGPMGHGALHGTTLVCPWHAWEYDCRTGLNDFAAGAALATFPVKIEGDDILVDVPDGA
jgi:nitrite reductase (NADH) small subunit